MLTSVQSNCSLFSIGGRATLILLVLLLQSCAVITSPEAAPVPGQSPLMSPLSPAQVASPSPGVAPGPIKSPLNSPLPSPSPVSSQMATVSARAAPDLTLQRENGQTVRLSDARGKTVVLVFYRGQT